PQTLPQACRSTTLLADSKELRDNRSFARVFRGPTWIQVGFGEPPKPGRRGDRSPDITSWRKLRRLARRTLWLFRPCQREVLRLPTAFVRRRTCVRPRLFS